MGNGSVRQIAHSSGSRLWKLAITFKDGVMSVLPGVLLILMANSIRFMLFVYFLSVVLLFYTCLPLQYVTYSICAICKTERKTLTAALLNFALLIFVLFTNRHYNAIYSLISGKLAPVFWLFANLLPLFALCLPKKPKNGQKLQNEGTMYALKLEKEDNKVKKSSRKGV